MSNSWSGLYLKADRESVSDALLVLATARGQQIYAHIDNVDRTALDEVLGEFNYSDLGKVVDIVLLLALDNGWTRVIGRDILDACFPRMFYSSDLVLLLACDAFECGFLDTASWWYTYYESGQSVDRFDSDPRMTFTDSIGNIFGPDDPRVIYCRCVGLDRHQVRALPAEVLRQYQGQPEKLEPVAKGRDTNALRDLMSKGRLQLRPEDAIERLRETLIFPDVGDYQVYHFTQAVREARYRSEPDPDWIGETIQAGLTMMILTHPKSLFGIQPSTTTRLRMTTRFHLLLRDFAFAPI